MRASTVLIALLHWTELWTGLSARCMVPLSLSATVTLPLHFLFMMQLLPMAFTCIATVSLLHAQQQHPLWQQQRQRHHHHKRRSCLEPLLWACRLLLQHHGTCHPPLLLVPPATTHQPCLQHHPGHCHQQVRTRAHEGLTDCTGCPASSAPSQLVPGTPLSFWDGQQA